MEFLNLTQMITGVLILIIITYLLENIIYKELKDIENGEIKK